MESKKDVFMQVVTDRRSIRNYTDDKTSEEDLRLILESARQAPSGENAQPWRFIVVKDEKNKEFFSPTWAKCQWSKIYRGISKQTDAGEIQTLKDEKRK